MPDRHGAAFAAMNFVDLSLYESGWEACKPLHVYGPAYRNHFLFHYILQGRGKLVSTNENGATSTYSLEAGQGFLIWPRQHNTYQADEHDPWVYTWVEFDGLKAREIITQSGLTFNYPVYTSQNSQAREELKNSMLFLAQNQGLPHLQQVGHLYLLMDALLNSSSHKRKVAGENLKDFYVREVLNYIENHYQAPITVEDIARYCSLNRSYVGKIFKAALGTSLQEFLMHYRLGKACEMLKITSHPIKDVSAMVGYPNQLHFSRVFKNAYGVSPRAWREANRLR